MAHAAGRRPSRPSSASWPWPAPLLKLMPSASGAASFWAGRLEVTVTGLEVLAWKRDWIDAHGGIERWLGGVHLQGPKARWRWDEAVRRIVEG
ncbi:MAG: hypothetical protein HY721_33260 [Planctomycetes bacterium]|nr:hypothetical protein [Planctomycetota bacterium]